MIISGYFEDNKTNVDKNYKDFESKMHDINEDLRHWHPLISEFNSRDDSIIPRESEQSVQCMKNIGTYETGSDIIFRYSSHVSCLVILPATVGFY